MISKGGYISKTIPGTEGVIRLHMKGAGEIILGDQSFSVPSIKSNADGFVHVELLKKNGQVELSVNNKSIKTVSYSGQNLKIKGAASIRNVVFIPFKK